MKVTLSVNSASQVVDVAPLTPLVEVLREALGLRGTKIGCGNGECGACTVLIDGQAMCSCIVPIHRAEGRAIITIEGLARDGSLSRVQRAFVEMGATQCGFCAPGMIMSATALLLRTPNPTREQVVQGLGGNVCRCTGYTPIIEAVMLAATTEADHAQ
jgi:aerobic-type carbon monoxide dehydrogenase small subunit (CoxS/CutS family)